MNSFGTLREITYDISRTLVGLIMSIVSFADLLSLLVLVLFVGYLSQLV